MTTRVSGMVSTIIPVYNRPQLLAEAVTSVLGQTYRPLELIIVDDGSTDGTAVVGQAFAASHPGVVRYVRKENEGFTRAINTGLPLVSGEFVQFLDSDDLLMPDKFAAQVGGLRSNSECGISYCYAREYVFGGPWSGQPARRTGETFTQLFPHILSGRLWPSPVPLYRRDVIEANGLYPELSIHPEWEYECRAAARGVRLHHAPMFLTDVRGVHHLEGRTKGDVPASKLPDYVSVLEAVWGHARAAGQPARALEPFARRVSAVARLCDEAGADVEARRCRAITAAIAADRTVGDRVIARAQSVWRLSREVPPFLRGKNILRRYTAHYRRARRVYNGAGDGTARALGSPRDVGVRVMRPDAADTPIALPPGYEAIVARVAAGAVKAFEVAANCRCFPSAENVISIELRDPFAIDGLDELCDPLLLELERALYGSYTIADKVYVYRSAVTQARPQKSWLWHFDNHPREMLKVMVYLTDVTDGTAPFEYVRARSSGRPLYGSPLAPGFGTSRVPAERIERCLAQGWERQTVTGPRGTIVLFDDNVVHRATLATRGHRDVVVFQIRPSTFKALPHIDSRWTGTFGHRQLNTKPDDLESHRAS